MKHNKFNAKKVYIGNLVFDSQKEANRYGDLKLLERAGVIKNLQMQVPFELIPAQYEEVITFSPKQHKEKRTQKLIERKVEYIADFVYEENGQTVVEDVKGYRDSVAYQLFVIKRKLMLQVYGIKVKEV